MWVALTVNTPPPAEAIVPADVVASAHATVALKSPATAVGSASLMRPTSPENEVAAVAPNGVAVAVSGAAVLSTVRSSRNSGVVVSTGASKEIAAKAMSVDGRETASVA